MAVLQACDAVDAIAKPEFKARMTVRLKVAGAFHTDFMAPAVRAPAAKFFPAAPLSAPPTAWHAGHIAAGCCEVAGGSKPTRCWPGVGRWGGR